MEIIAGIVIIGTLVILVAALTYKANPRSAQKLTANAPVTAPRPAAPVRRPQAPAEVDEEEEEEFYDLVPFESEDGRGYVLRRLPDKMRLRWDFQTSPPVMALQLERLARTRKVLDDPSFAPGNRLALEEEERKRGSEYIDVVSVWNADKTLKIGYLPADEGEEAVGYIDEGEVSALSMWETLNAGKRVGLRVLLVFKGATVTFGER